MAKKRAASTKKKKAGKPKPRLAPGSPREPRLPEMADHLIEGLEACASDMEDIKNERESLNKQEATVKARAASILREHKKTAYKRGRVAIVLKGGEDKITITIAKAKDDDKG